MTRFAFRHASLAQDRRGSTLVEFAFIAPALCLLLIGAFDIAHTLYMQAALQGAVQKAARDSSLESSTSDVQTIIDNRVRTQIRPLANADVLVTRKSYHTFANAAIPTPESWTDTNGNHVCDDNEPYVDANRNNSWDADGANTGQGGAHDKTVYTVTVKYQRLFPLNNFINVPAKQTVVAKAVVQNQPYSDQADVGTTVLHCS